MEPIEEFSKRELNKKKASEWTHCTVCEKSLTFNMTENRGLRLNFIL